MRTGGAKERSAAALRGAGGWDENLLCLEGTDTSIRTRMAGYKGKAAANVVVFTELPSTLSAFKSQQMRWIWAWAHLAKRHALAVAFNSYSGVPGTFARAWFALALLRPAQWVLLAVWVLMPATRRGGRVARKRRLRRSGRGVAVRVAPGVDFEGGHVRGERR